MTDETKTCQVKMHDGDQCPRPLWDDDHCICHSHDPHKDVEIFQLALDCIFNDPDADYYDLRGFLFPSEGYRLPSVYTKPVFFELCRFSGYVEFFGAEFHDEACFRLTAFRGDTDFTGSQFFRRADFSVSRFERDAQFSRCQFLDQADFSYSRWESKMGFEHALFRGKATFYHSMALADCRILFDGEPHGGCVFENGADFSSFDIADPRLMKFRKVSLVE